MMIEFKDLEGLLRDYFSSNDNRILIICPFISNSMLESILPGDANQNVTIVTSWRKDHLRNRVSHVDLFPLAEERGWTLYHNDKLHLKFYSNNLEDGFIGSANLTGKALMDRPGDNIEGLIYLENLDFDDRVFIESIIAQSGLVTQEVYDVYRDWYEENKQESPEELPPIPSIQNSNSDDFLISKLPATDSPSRLWSLVSNESEPDYEWREDLAMVHDLALFGLTSKLPKDEFIRVLKKSFFSKPFVKLFSEQIDEEGLHFGAAKEWIQNNCTTVPTPYRKELTPIVKSLYNWYAELDPEKFETIEPNVSKILRLKTGLTFDKYCEITGRRLDRSWYVSSSGFPDDGVQYKSCPWCSKLHGSRLIFRLGRVYPDSDSNRTKSEFGFTPQRRNRSNLDGIQTWCKPCRSIPKPTKLPPGGLTIDDLDDMIGTSYISSRPFG